MGEKSKQLFQRAQRYIPGGVNSPVRAFRAVGGEPLFIQRAGGSRIYDVDGRAYIDYVGSWGPMILGHAPSQVTAALKGAVDDGTSYGAPTELEIELACQVVEAVPSVELVRMVSSGTEATMSALRLARAYTDRDMIVKFEGCYHGHGDSLLVKAGSGAATLGVPDSPGVPRGLASLTLTLPYNDLQAVRDLFSRRGREVAAVIVEPIAGNMGVIPPVEGFLRGLRELTTQYGALLLFDEVITGFRVAYGGAQQLYGVLPDLTCLGKILGGGLPVGAYGGKREILGQMAPGGPVYQAGTLSGNPLAMVAGRETLKALAQGNPYQELEEKTRTLCQGIEENVKKVGIPACLTRVGSLFCLFFREGPVRDYQAARGSDTQRFGRYFQAMLDQGIYLAPSQFEAGFVSLAHTWEDIEQTAQANRVALEAAARG
ncbi:MAG: glutamate-1-semialdehyde 2,1-aminomutase [Candidatus Tectomicrobia bacterium]|uniref:Glutamate-1-semialdehyde 2,1-aminomutase n=1 Tax=Tectimicrobiota bacterium TaxID=2528274 RepID=A0A932CPL3_UNCTE|nr:glutamate-1-semialdehyde 2,1-aminomutase [Candidatus Tectomicrobia bacterium]